MFAKLNFVLFKILFLIFLTACLPSNTSYLSEQEDIQTKEFSLEQTAFDFSNRPDFIIDLIPRENSQTSLPFYNAKGDGISLGIAALEQTGHESSVCIRVDLFMLVQEGDIWLEASDITDKMELRVNGHQLNSLPPKGFGVLASNLNFPDNEWIDGLTYCWLTPLEVGFHEAEFSFVQSSGDVKSYSWQFEIIPEQGGIQTKEVSLEQTVFDISTRPDFIIDVGPHENSQISLGFYNGETEGIISLEIESLKQHGYGGSICVRPDLSRLVQGGEDWVYTNVIQERMSLTINGKEMANVSSMGRTVIVANLNIPDTEWLDGLTYCWVVPLEVGLHQAEFSFVQSSGDVKSYSWQFEIIP